VLPHVERKSRHEEEAKPEDGRCAKGKIALADPDVRRRVEKIDNGLDLKGHAGTFEADGEEGDEGRDDDGEPLQQRPPQLDYRPCLDDQGGLDEDELRHGEDGGRDADPCVRGANLREVMGEEGVELEVRRGEVQDEQGAADDGDNKPRHVDGSGRA